MKKGGLNSFKRRTEMNPNPQRSKRVRYGTRE